MEQLIQNIDNKIVNYDEFDEKVERIQIKHGKRHNIEKARREYIWNVRYVEVSKDKYADKTKEDLLEIAQMLKVQNEQLELAAEYMCKTIDLLEY